MSAVAVGLTVRDPGGRVPPSITSVWPFPYRSASDGVEKPLSAVKNGHPGSTAPFAALNAYSS